MKSTMTIPQTAISSSVMALALCLPFPLKAQDSSMRGSQVAPSTTHSPATSANSVIQGSGTRTSANSAPANYAGYGGAGTSMNQGAKNARGQALIGAASNGVAAGFWYSQCTKTKWYACALGALHVAQGAMMLQGARGAGNTAAATQYGTGGMDSSGYDSGWVDYDGDGVPDGPPGDGGPGGGTAGAFNDRVAKTQKELDSLAGKFGSAGYKLSPDGTKLTLPDGRQVPTSAFGNESDLTTLGMSANDLATMNALKAQLANKMKDKIKALAAEDSGGGGGGMGRGGSRGTASAPGFNGFGSLFGDKKDKKAATAKGLSKQLGSDRIGVAADNIFEMISRQYVKEDGKQNFIQPVVGAPPTAGK